MTNQTLAHQFRIRALLWRAVFLLVALTAAGVQAQTPDSTQQALNAFDKTTQDYVRMHRRLESEIGSIALGTPVDEINRRIGELAAAIRAERTDARQGDLFTPNVAHVLRARISDALFEHRYSADAVRAMGSVDGVDYARVRLEVNGTFPWRLATAMLPCLIDVLPPLPPELQYRIVGDDLVLIDIHASLIVDILPHAIVDLTARTWHR